MVHWKASYSYIRSPKIFKCIPVIGEHIDFLRAIPMNEESDIPKYAAWVD